jgi:hypothetical protein
MMNVGEIYVPNEQDFQNFKTECTSDNGWIICYDKSTCRVSTKKNSLSAFDVLRVRFKYLINYIIIKYLFRFNQN